MNVVHNVDISQFSKLYVNVGRGAPFAVERGLRRAGRMTVQRLKARTLQLRKVDLRQVLEGWRWSLVKQGSTLRLDVGNAASHAVYVEFGRRPGRPPPSQALEGWARRKLGNARLAFVVARAIGRRGIAKTPLLTDPAFARRMREAVSTEVHKEMGMLWGRRA